MVGIMAWSCSSDEEMPAEYYVRYIAMTNGENGVTINYTDENEQIITVQMPGNYYVHQFTVGPVRRGFKANLSASYRDVGGAVEELMIEASENGKPFVVKKRGEHYINLEWTVE